MTEPIYDTDLKPCPFCGSPAHIVWGAKRRVYGSQKIADGACVYCETCNVRMFSTAKHLIAEMWNRRADDDQLHAAEQIQIYQRLLEWAVECGFGYDNIPELYEQYKNEIDGMSYTDGLLYLASRSLKQEG